MFDFGFDHNFAETPTYVRQKIERLSMEIDLMMINEYYDESLILLKQLMCWDFEDILYIPKGVRSKSHRAKLTHDLLKNIRKWNSADMLLYEHFNKTFWAKVGAYGPDFERDLATFRSLKQNMTEECVHPVKRSKKDRREDKFILKNQSCYCRNIMRDDVSYTRLLRKAMVTHAAEEATNHGL